MLANLLHALDTTLTSTPGLSPTEPLPMTLNQLTLEFSARPRVPSQSSTPPG
jgi:hypothetical protein